MAVTYPGHGVGLRNVGSYQISLNTNEDSFTFDVKCKEIYITNSDANAGFMLYASLTGIPTGSMYALTGSGLTELSSGPE